MNINNLMKSGLFSIVLLCISGLAIADGGFPARISAQMAEINKARSSNQIDSAEEKMLKKEMQGIEKLFDQYYGDRKISVSESKILDAKLDQAEVNLFREKYD